MPYKDKEKQKEAQHESYLRNKEETILRTKIRRKEVDVWITEYKKTLKCENCIENRWYVLDFHHKEKRNESRKREGKKDKLTNIANLRHRYSLERIKEEIQKCIPLCANCHRELHWKEKMEASPEIGSSALS